MERKDVPIHLVFRRNIAEGLANLSLIERIARKSLELNPTGSVGIFIEAANTTAMEANFFQSQIQKGATPADALIASHFMKYPKPIAWILSLVYKLDYLLSPNAFSPNDFGWRRIKLLDTLSQDYPKRVYPILEQGTPDDVNLNWLAGRLQIDITSNPDLRFDPDSPDLYPAASTLEDGIRRKRQDRIAALIKKTILETDIVCFVGHLFATYHRVGFALERAGFAVHRHFPETD